MSILSVDTIQPIGSGSTVTLNAAKTAVGTGITFESNGQAIYAGIITATSFSGTASNASGATGDFSIADKIVHTGDTNTAIRFPSADSISFETGGSERVRINSTGNMGLGVSDPNVLNEPSKFQELTLGGKTEGAGIHLKDDNGNVQGGIFTSDNTGAMIIRTITNHYMQFRTNNTERLRIASTGQVNIGNTGANWVGPLSIGSGASGAAQVLQIYSNSDTYGAIFFGDATSGAGRYVGDITYNHSSNYMRFVTNGTERLRILSNGGVGINTSNFSSSLNNEPGLAIHGTGNDSCRIVLTTPTKANPPSSIGYFGLNRLGIDCYDGVEIRDVTASYATRMKIDQNGKFEVLSNRASANAQLFQNISSTNPEGLYIQFTQAAPNTSSRHFLKCSDNAGDKMVIDTNGNLRNLNNSYGGFSDASLKENIVDASSQWNDIKNVKVRVFNFKTDDASDKRIGVVAQEIETVCPKLVDEVFDKDSDGNLLQTSIKSVKYSILHMKSIKALQEAQARIETLEAKVATLEGS